MPKCKYCGCDYPAGHGELCFLNPDNIRKCVGCKSLMRFDNKKNERVEPDRPVLKLVVNNDAQM